MKRIQVSLVVLALASGALLAAGCGDKSTSLDVAVAPTPEKVGSEQCTNTCHASTVDVTGNPIAATWLANQSAHGGRVGCEDCHGGGANHWGVGPIPYPNPPITQCLACHGRDVGEAEFTETAHANADNLPPPDYFNAPFGDGSDNALMFGAPIYDLDTRGRKVAVSKAQHAQECSVCHNASVRFDIDPANKALLKPDPASLPKPIVGCSSCHDGHQPDVRIATPTRTRAVAMFNFRNYMVDNATFAQTPTPPSLTNPGVRYAGTIYMTNGAVQLSGTPDYTRVVENNNDIYPERLCAACHTKGKYMFTAVNAGGNDISATHQTDVYTQYRLSGHGDRSGAPFGEFSANPSFYGFANDHRISYPYDMALSSTGIPANATRNAEGSFACMKCHHGLGSLAYQDNVEGTSGASVLFGDVSVTCLTCHDPHANVPGQDFNTRKPVVFTKYSNKRATDNVSYAIAGNVFLDNTAVPSATGNATICAYCHQGRESGLTLYTNKGFGQGGTGFGSSFQNPHYLGTAAMVWARNGYEYAGKTYGANAAHQNANCTTCHMGNPTTPAGNGGHTWIVNYASCNKPFTDGAGFVTQCHNTGGALPAIDNDGTAFPNADIYRAAADTANYTGDTGGESLSIADSVQVLSNKVMLLLATQGLYYNDTAYPYCFTVQDPAFQASDNAFKSWTPAIYKAAFNLQFVIKGLPSAGAGTSTVTIPNPGGNTAWDIILPDTSNALPPASGGSNPSAATHNYEYTIQLLQDSYKNLYDNVAPAAKAGFTDPALMARPSNGTQRAATAYGPNQ